MTSSLPIDYRWLPKTEIVRLAEIDRSEHISGIYTMKNGRLEYRKVDFQAPPWNPEGDGPHSVADMIHSSQKVLDLGGLLLGAFAGHNLVGVGILRLDLTPTMAQLALLHVSRPFRGRGIASRLTEMMCSRATAQGAQSIYVSATPTVNTVTFYQRRGFTVTASPHPKLLAEEPEDIHLIRPLSPIDVSP